MDQKFVLVSLQHWQCRLITESVQLGFLLFIHESLAMLLFANE
jgi:hypothetical protein